MKFTLTVNLNNAAFDDNASDELARILRDAANSVGYSTDRESLPRLAAVWDINGNRVGEYKIED